MLPSSTRMTSKDRSDSSSAMMSRRWSVAIVASSLQRGTTTLIVGSEGVEGNGPRIMQDPPWQRGESGRPARKEP